MTDENGYLLANAQVEAGQRFDALSELFNPGTFRRLAALGVAAGWHVWEVGAGGPTVASWLAERVGAEGKVLATDIATTRIDHAVNYEVRRHDVGVDAPPPGPFDLVHARLLLVHVPRREQALAAMVSSLAPGGWLVVEEADPALQPLVCLDEFGPAQQLANRLKVGFRELLAQRGVNLAYRRTLPRRLREAGLLEVAAEGFFPITGRACNELERATVEQIRNPLVSGGIAANAEIDEHLHNVVSAEMDLATSPMITAWGRKSPER